MTRSIPIVPRTADDALAILERAYPEPRPGPEQTTNGIMFDAGARSVVLRLRQIIQAADKAAD